MYFENFSNSVKPLARKGEGNTEPSLYSYLLQGKVMTSPKRGQ